MLSEYPANLDETLFGHVTGHLVPGTIFILIGFWWLYNVVFDIRTAQSVRLDEARPYISKVWYGVRRVSSSRIVLCRHLLEPLIKIVMGLVGVFMELTGAHWTLFDTKGEFESESINNFSHATMFVFFSLSGVVDLLQEVRILNGKMFSKLGHIAIAFAFFIEGVLFCFHLDGRSAIDSHSHGIIYSLCFATSVVFILESVWPGSGMLGLARCFLVILQGTWFYQITFMLYGPRRWSEKSASAAMFVPIAFAWHCFVILIAILAALILTDKCIKASRYCSTDCETLSMENLLDKEEEENSTLASGVNAVINF